MKFYSTNKQSAIVNFKEAAINGQAPDKGLYFPEKIPLIKKELIENLGSYSNQEIAFQVIRPYVADTIGEEDLYNIVGETINFPIPLVEINSSISSLELFHGPTLAFKDVGARFMSRCLGHFVKGDARKVTVLVATSGDTGGAVANGFYNVDGVEVIILYPSGKVSSVQEKQLTTLGNNIHALEIEGSFDDCQQMVKQAFIDNDLRKAKFLTSANSINVARWLPQQFYYFFALKQWKNQSELPVISVPSGNFGNICAGILAMQSGLPVKHFIAACNINDVMSDYFQTGTFAAKNAVPTISNAMDVGNPSNFIRILEIFNHDFSSVAAKLSSATVTDAATKACIQSVYKNSGYILDPHAAVGYVALERYLQQNPSATGFLLETAHPVKFPDAVSEMIGKEIDIPAAVQDIMLRKKSATLLKPQFEELKSFLLSRN